MMMMMMMITSDCSDLKQTKQSDKKEQRFCALLHGVTSADTRGQKRVKLEQFRSIVNHTPQPSYNKNNLMTYYTQGTIIHEQKNLVQLSQVGSTHCSHALKP
eukprot:4737713-Amphidinium_carterae.2